MLALEELAFFSKELTMLGVYPAHAYRDTFKEEKDWRSAAGLESWRMVWRAPTRVFPPLFKRL